MDDALDGGDIRMGGKRPSAIPLDRATAMTVGARTRCCSRTSSEDRVGQGRAGVVVLEGKYGARLPRWKELTSSYPLMLISPASDQRIT